MAHPSSGKEPAAPCAATTVHYGATKVGTPWIAGGTTFTGHVFYYSGIEGDGRVNRSDGLVAYAGVPGKVLWIARRPARAGARLVVSARRLDGDGAFTQRLPARGVGQFPSELALPAAGCWRLALRSGKLSTSVVVQAVAPPAEARCDATPVIRDDPPHPHFGRVIWLQATPRSSGVAAISFVSVVPGADRALIYAGGLAPEGWSTKFLWWAPHAAPTLTLTGRRLDAVGRFVQRFGNAASGGDIVYPSIVDIPSAGCWAVTVQIGQAAGLVVFQAVVTS